MNKPTQIIPSEQFAAMAAQAAADAVSVSDAEGRIEWANEAFARITGHPIDDLVGRHPADILQGPETDRETLAAIGRARAERRAIVTDILQYRADGGTYWAELHMTPVFDNQGAAVHFVTIQRDVTHRKRREVETADLIQREKHRETERQLLSQVSEWLYSAKSLEELLLVARKAMSTLIPEAEGSLYIYSESRDTLEVASAWGDNRSIDPVDPDACWALRRGRAYNFGTRAIEFACDHVGTEDHPFFCLPIVADGETIGMLHLRFTSFSLRSMDRKMLDIFINHRWNLSLLCAEQMSLAIANVRLRQVLLEKSVRDPLTNLWNRRWLVDTTNKMLAQARTGDGQLSLISIDIDHFKAFNDTFGHEAGDVVLRKSAEVMVDVARDRGAVCRAGGEEFVVLCPGLDGPQAVDLANEIRDGLSALRLTSDGNRLSQITASAGVATYSRGHTATDLLRASDAALYRAKHLGRNRVVNAADLDETDAPPPKA